MDKQQMKARYLLGGAAVGVVALLVLGIYATNAKDSQLCTVYLAEDGADAQQVIDGPVVHIVSSLSNKDYTTRCVADGVVVVDNNDYTQYYGGFSKLDEPFDSTNTEHVVGVMNVDGSATSTQQQISEQYDYRKGVVVGITTKARSHEDVTTYQYVSPLGGDGHVFRLFADDKDTLELLADNIDLAFVPNNR